ncbi:MAG TPA: replicative DNA helicase, partial [Chloroflexaceae bacterium]|nr:replicative DNA helicase [Chloroflexaceae bacterium]
HRREPPDLATVAAELRRHERLDLVGGFAFLGELAAETPTAVHVEYYARIVERTAVLRRLIEAGGKIAALGYDEAPDLESTLDQAEAEVFAVSQRRSTQAFVPAGQVVNEIYTRIELMRARGGRISGLATGYHDLDAITGGLQPSDLILLAARPSLGKTSLALSLGYNVAFAGATVGVFSLEMSRDQLMQRILAMHTGIDMQRLRLGDLRDDELARAFDGMGVLSELPIHIDDTPGLSVTEVRSRARRLVAEQGCDLLIVDYLQLMSGGGSKENRVQEVSEISRGLKALARELDAPVIALSQLSRAVEARQDHVPMLSDLRESGSLEQDADLVWFIYRDEVYDKESEKRGLAEVHIAKHRNGPLGVVPLRFEARTTRFQNLEAYRAPEGY